MKKTKFITLTELLTKIQKEPLVDGIAISTCNCKNKPGRINFTIKNGKIILENNSPLGSSINQLISVYDSASKIGERGEIILSTPKIVWKINYYNKNKVITEITH